jgi:toxoflavin biosynthesis protein ToxC
VKHIGPISGIACHPSGHVATAGYDNQVILWNAASHKPEARGAHDHLANQCTFTPDGKHVVSSSSDYSARLWTVPDMRLAAIYVGHTDDIEMTVVHPDGTRVATCSRDTDIRTFMLDGTPIGRLQGHEADVISVGWEGNSDLLISSSDDGTVRRWNGTTGELLETIDLGGVETDTIVITDTGTIFAGNDNGELLTIKGKTVTATPAHNAGIKRLAYSQTSHQIVSLSYDRKLIIWKVGSGESLVKWHEADLPPMIWPRSVAFQSDEVLVFGTFGSTYATYDSASGNWSTDGIEPDIAINAVVARKGKVYSIGDAGKAFQDGSLLCEIGSLCNFLVPFGDSILTGGQIGKIFDAKTGLMLHQHRSPLNCGTTFIKDGVQYAIIGTYTGEGLVFRLDETGVPRYVGDVALDENAIKGLAASVDYIFSVCATGGTNTFLIADFTKVPEYSGSHDKIANGCTSLPDGTFASVSRDLTLRLWKAGGFTIHPAPLRNSIKCVAASADGRHIAAGSYGGHVAIFDVEKRSWISMERVSAAGISCVAATDMPGAFLASAYDGQIHEVKVVEQARFPV